MTSVNGHHSPEPSYHFAQRDDVHGEKVSTSKMDKQDQSVQNLFTHARANVKSSVSTGTTNVSMDSVCESVFSKFQAISYSTKTEASAEQADEKLDSNMEELIANAKEEAQKEIQAEQQSSASSSSSSSSGSSSDTGSVITSIIGSLASAAPTIISAIKGGGDDGGDSES